MDTFILPGLEDGQLPSEDEQELVEIFRSRKESTIQKQHCPTPRLYLCLLPNEAVSVP